MLICRNNVYKEVTEEKFEKIFKAMGYEAVKGNKAASGKSKAGSKKN